MCVHNGCRDSGLGSEVCKGVYTGCKVLGLV